MDFKKERNFIVAYDENNVTQGKWNILTGEFIGKSDKVVKRCPRCFTNLASRWSKQTSITERVVSFYREFPEQYTPARGARLEQLISVGLMPYYWYDCDDNIKLTKEIVQICKEDHNGYYDHNRINKYVISKKYANFFAEHEKWVEEVFISLAYEDDIPVDFLKTFLIRAEREQIKYMWTDDNPAYEISSFTKDYYTKSMSLYGKVEVKPNLLSNYAYIFAIYEDYRNKNYNKVLPKNNDIPALYFKFGNYEARPLLTCEEFHEEAKSQDNCVERIYMKKVFENETHVVTIRNTNTPEKSCITCEVSNEGTIVQYLRAHNMAVTNAEQLAFKRAYINHLRENF